MTENEAYAHRFTLNPMNLQLFSLVVLFFFYHKCLMPVAASAPLQQ